MTNGLKNIRTNLPRYHTHKTTCLQYTLTKTNTVFNRAKELHPTAIDIFAADVRLLKWAYNDKITDYIFVLAVDSDV